MSRIWNGANRSIRLLALTVGLVACPAVLAFKPELHFKYTIRASQELAACNLSPQIDPWLVGKLAVATDKEDTTDLLDRVTNWHHAPTEELPEDSTFLLAHLTMANVFEERRRQLYEAIRQDGCRTAEVFHRAGGVLHFLQDMRVPAHVIPIHHGGAQKDGFDEHDFGFEFSGTKRAFACGELDAEARSIAALATGGKREDFMAALERIRERAGGDTHEMIGSRWPATSCTAGDIFWCKPGERKNCAAPLGEGFGSYRKSPKSMGKKRKTIGFGEKELACGEDLVIARDEDYQKLFEAYYRKMLYDSALMLRLAQVASAGCRATGY